MPDSSIATTLLAEGFPAATREAWSGLVEKTLKGAGLDSLVTRGPDGLAIQPLYERWRDGPTRDPRRADLPVWDIRARIAQPNTLRANADLLEDLAGGATSALLVIARPGQPGIVAGSAVGMARLLDGVMPDVAPLALDAGFLGPLTADWLADAAKSAPAAELAFHFDPLSAFAAGGVSPGPIEAHLALAAERGAALTSTYPKASLFLASGKVAHEAGAAPAAELAFAAAAAVAYVKALAQAGLSAPDALKTLVLAVAVDDDILVSVAKLRAARVVWDKIAATWDGPTPARIEARAGLRGLTRAEPWTNLTRLTVAAFAAAVGGADAIVLPTFTDPLGLPTPLARRMARNSQLILMHEAHLGEVSDPPRRRRRGRGADRRPGAGRLAGVPRHRSHGWSGGGIARRSHRRMGAGRPGGIAASPGGKTPANSRRDRFPRYRPGRRRGGAAIAGDGRRSAGSQAAGRG